MSRINYKVVFYKKENQEIPVLEWLESHDDKQTASLHAAIESLAQNGNILLGTNSLKRLTGNAAKLLEITRGGVRCVLFRDTDKYVLLYAFKKQKQIQRHDIGIAISYYEDYLNRKEYIDVY